MDVAVPILGSAPCDKAAYHKGLKSVEQKLEVLDAHLRSRTFLVSTCQKCCQGHQLGLCNAEASMVVAAHCTDRNRADVWHGSF